MVLYWCNAGGEGHLRLEITFEFGRPGSGSGSGSFLCLWSREDAGVCWVYGRQTRTMCASISLKILDAGQYTYNVIQ
jgi:hypothetical protein